MGCKLRSITIFAVVLTAFALTAAGTVVAPVGGSITATAGLTGDLGTTLFIDLRGPILLEVFDPASLGFVIASDYGAPAPNAVLVASNGAITEFASMTFATGAPGYAPDFSTMALGVAIAPAGPVSDPALAAFLGDWVVVFGLTDVSGGAETGFLLTYQFREMVEVDARIPEPSTALLGLAGLGLIVWGRRRTVR